MRITLGVVALMALAAVAVASPFAGVEATAGKLGFEAGVSNYGLSIYMIISGQASFCSSNGTTGA